jgi:hypothetical protein
MKKNLLIGLGAVAVAGIGYYLWKKSKGETKSNAAGEVCNKNRSNKPCLDWLQGKGWTNIPK